MTVCSLLHDDALPSGHVDQYLGVRHPHRARALFGGLVAETLVSTASSACLSVMPTIFHLKYQLEEIAVCQFKVA